MKIDNFINFFINPLHLTKPGTARRAHLFVRACFLTSIFSTSYVFLSILFGFEKGVYLMLFNVTGFFFLPFLAKTKIPISWLGNIYVFIGAFAVIVLTYFSGGVWSAIYPWIISIPVLALLVVNRLSGAIWGAISFIVMLWFAYYAYLEVDFPVEYNLEYKTLWYISIVPGLLLIILFISFVFEFNQSKALIDLEKKNAELSSQKMTIAEQSLKLEELIEEKDYIIRILAHDLRNPLNNIASLVQFIQKENDKKPNGEYVNMIAQSTESANSLVNRVLELDASNQENDIHLENINVCDVISETINTMRKTAEKKHISIDVKRESNTCLVFADQTYLSLIFENLISNAIKFSQKEKRIVVIIINNETDILVKVVDEGPGVRPEEENQLFTKFSKLSARPTAGESSTGLGLSLVKRYVKLINGKIWYEGQYGVGATFVVQIPLQLN